MITPVLHSVAAIAFERLLYCLAEGTLLALALALAMRLIPEKSSRTKFTIWFSALLASVVLPFIGLAWSAEAGAIQAQHSLVTLPISAVLYAFVAWLLVACIALARVFAGVWQLRRLRQGCTELNDQQLGSELAGILSDFRKVRRVSVLVSQNMQVPTAVGFFKPAVIIPGWMMDEGPSEELKHVLLHELAHLRRRDDWTNLIQKIVKAVLFFHPGVWWMERELSLEREIACDDAVLEQTTSPHRYAECLARVAEKSFLRRQIALAQAAVSRMSQLTSRVTRILDPNRRSTTEIWKPAIPGVAALALISGVSGLWAPGLIRVNDSANVAAVSKAVPDSVVNAERMAPLATPASTHGAIVHSWTAGFKPRVTRANSQSLYVPARHTTDPAKFTSPRTTQLKTKQQKTSPVILAQYAQKSHLPTTLAPAQAEQPGEFVLVIETRQTVTEIADGWQVSVQQLRWLVPVSRIEKRVPSKI